MKKVPFTQAQFVASAFDLKSFPKMLTLGGDLMPEIALVGRSNVGKSSLINQPFEKLHSCKNLLHSWKNQIDQFFFDRRPNRPCRSTWLWLCKSAQAD